MLDFQEHVCIQKVLVFRIARFARCVKPGLSANIPQIYRGSKPRPLSGHATVNRREFWMFGFSLSNQDVVT